MFSFLIETAALLIILWKRVLQMGSAGKILVENKGRRKLFPSIHFSPDLYDLRMGND
jgi:hypothetical protein